jgi:hypothetical protein
MGDRTTDPAHAHDALAAENHPTTSAEKAKQVRQTVKNGQKAGTGNQ